MMIEYSSAYKAAREAVISILEQYLASANEDLLQDDVIQAEALKDIFTSTGHFFERQPAMQFKLLLDLIEDEQCINILRIIGFERYQPQKNPVKTFYQKSSAALLRHGIRDHTLVPRVKTLNGMMHHTVTKVTMPSLFIHDLQIRQLTQPENHNTIQTIIDVIKNLYEGHLESYIPLKELEHIAKKLEYPEMKANIMRIEDTHELINEYFPKTMRHRLLPDNTHHSVKSLYYNFKGSIAS